MAPRAGRRLRVLLAAGVAGLSPGGCGKQNAYAPPPPPQVGVAAPVARVVTPYLETTGSTAAFNQVDLVARVQGFVQSIDYQDGAEVPAGRQLFVIEPAPYQAKLQQAQAALASAQAQFNQADAELHRQAQLGRSDFASQSAVDQARATRDADQANVSDQQAGVALAGLNLGYTHVNAPFAGVATRHLVSVGDLVGVSEPTKLATVVQLDPIHVTFSITEPDVQRIRAELARAGLTLAQLGRVTVEVGLQTETGFPHHGVLDYAAPQVDASTGTLQLRAVLANPQRTLLPGYFVRVRIPQMRAAAQALLVPDAALGADQAGPYVLVLDRADTVEQRGVRPGQREGSLRVIEAGLQPGDRVIVSGLARAVPGQKAAPMPAAKPPSG